MPRSGDGQVPARGSATHCKGQKSLCMGSFCSGMFRETLLDLSLIQVSVSSRL